jgi:hypothetical protein
MAEPVDDAKLIAHCIRIGDRAATPDDAKCMAEYIEQEEDIRAELEALRFDLGEARNLREAAHREVEGLKHRIAAVRKALDA